MPLSDTIIRGLPRLSTSIVSSRAARLPDIVVSGIAAEAFPCHVINNVEDAQTPTAAKLVVDKVEGPAGIGFGLDEDW